MKPIVLITALVALVQGRPEAGYSYSPPAPSGSYGVPGSGIGLASLNGLGGGIGGISGGHGLSSGISLGSSYSGAGIGLGGGSFSGISSGIGGGAGAISLAGSGAGIDSGYVGGSSGGTIVQKHIYVHVPPPEPEDIRPQRPIHVPAAQKHYKIIFIKAPAPPTPTVPSIPLQPQNEEKTLVYVLVKKPEEAPEITIPTAAPTQPSKPEVYFIRYKTQKEVSGGGIATAGISGAGAIGGGSLDASSLGGGIALGGGSLDIGHGSSGLSVSGGHGSSGLSIGGGHGSVSSGSISSGSSGLSTSYGPPGKSGPY